MEILNGDPALPGAVPDRDGTRFSLWSGVAERVELCLFDEHGNQTALDLPACDDGTWHGFVPGVGQGRRYGYRVHGPWNPGAGLRCNPAKLLLDPYALQVVGAFDWQGRVFDYELADDGTQMRCDSDNAGSVPVGVVRARGEQAIRPKRVPDAETVFYECNLRGYTMRHPAVPDADRGRFAGMANGNVLAYIKSLGITTIELMPLLAFIDEQHLAKNGLRNFWGYNTIGFFAPMPRFGGNDPVGELIALVRAIHDAGLEVVLDVAYNHTGESDGIGPTLSLRGIDNLAYYRTEPDNPGAYINDTGCGNTINADHPKVQTLVLDSLRYLHRTIGFDGFRFDLATILGRHGHGFSGGHPLLTAIAADPALAGAKLVAEPWDPGPGGYQLGAFPPGWSEWNDSFRDTVRRFWRGDDGTSGDLARRVHGSADIFEASGRPPQASVNLVTAHDGFTLADVVSYERRHNLANGEKNRDGHAHNFSRNHGVEGPTDNEDIIALRRRQRLNLLATLLLSQGTPMLLAGDEFGHSQHGNNNAYAQDNETAWLDWRLADRDPEFVEAVKTLVRLRAETPALRLGGYIHDDEAGDFGFEWFNVAGEQKQSEEWASSRAFSVRIRAPGSTAIILFNGGEDDADIALPPGAERPVVAFTSGRADPGDGLVTLQRLSLALLLT